MNGKAGGEAGLYRSTIGTLIHISLGPVLWGMHLTAVYLAESMLCAHRVGLAFIPAITVVATISVLVIIAVAIAAPKAASRLCRASGWDAAERRFQSRVMAALGVVSMAGVAWAGLTALIVPVCVDLR